MKAQPAGVVPMGTKMKNKPCQLFFTDTVSCPVYIKMNEKETEERERAGRKKKERRQERKRRKMKDREKNVRNGEHWEKRHKQR